MADTILYRREGHIGYLVLNCPDRHNALGAEELRLIGQHLDTVAAEDQARTLVVTGAGDKTFCAGASLQQLADGKLSNDAFREVTGRLEALAIPTICAMNGHVFGAGVELALACDFRIGVEGSRMRVPAAAIGICYPPSGISRLVNCLGVSVARRILLAAEVFDAQAMLQVGFLDHLVLPGGLQEACSELAEQVSGLAPLAVRSMKSILGQVVAGEVDEDHAARLAAMCAGSEDLAEGLAAQKEKRRPRFRGA
ncbi:MAG: enoyl-CoA hydratase/isomerase family protein [Pseudomonadales bacterium]|nr:enoyl-CoA hydratase/isomerase family protein [Pseudomonadales bacterium]